MNNNYLKTMPKCPVCGSTNVGFNLGGEMISSPNNVVIESFICEDCGHKWVITTYMHATIHRDNGGYWFHDMKGN